MKLRRVDFYLEWPVSIKIINLRRFIMENLTIKGMVIRWSIVEIRGPIDSSKEKKIRINAVLVDPIDQ